MRLNKELYIIAAEEAENVYAHADYQVGPRKTVEFSIVERELKNGMRINVLAIRGTDELRDWWKNFDMRCVVGWKKAAYDAAFLILGQNAVVDMALSPVPMLIAVHSKSGGTGFRIMSIVEKLRTERGLETFCVAFDPAESRKRNPVIELNNTVMFIDPDSIVNWIGWLYHPECKVIALLNDKWGFRPFSQHRIGHFLEFVKGMED